MEKVKKKMVGPLGRLVRNTPMRRLLTILIVIGLLGSILCFFVTILSFRPIQRVMTAEGREDIFNFYMYLAILFYVMLGIILAVVAFYRIKLWYPMRILQHSAARIAANDLDFHVDYPAKDEMGKLCDSFETMRAALEQNNRTMWHMAEERRQVNAAFAHDLRTPLTVLRGYADFLAIILPEGGYDPEKMLATVEKMSTHIERLQEYVETMSDAQRLEDTIIHPAEVNLDDMLKELNTTAELLSRESGKSVAILGGFGTGTAFLDRSIVLRVLENLLRNACQHAACRVSLRHSMADGVLCFTCSDDGPGLPKALLENGPRPFQKGVGSSGLGMGLYVCKLLCVAHGGRLDLANAPQNGTAVTAFFQIQADGK